LITIEHILIPWGLERNGDSREKALSDYGIIHSMVFPLVLFPSALSGAFAGLLVPEIAQSCVAEDHKRISRIINKVFYTVLTFSVGVAGIMMFFSYELSSAIYPNANAGKFVLMVAPLIPIMYLDTAVDGILKGLGEQVYCMGINIVDSFLSVILVWMLLPNMGISGYILTVYFTEIVNATLSIARLLTVTSIKAKLTDWLIKPLLCIVCSCGITRFLAKKLTGDIDSTTSLILYLIFTTTVYLFLVFITKPISLKVRQCKK
jgi:stage V sporulation protein B